MSRIALLLKNHENQRLLREMLVAHYEVIVPDAQAFSQESFDLGVVDGPQLDLWTPLIADRKAAESPLFLPFLLVTLRRDLGIASRHLWKTVDELLLLPIQKIELHARIEILLRARMQSLQLRDLHEQRERAVAAELEAARRLDRVKSTFVNAISHELRTPITTIMGYTEFLEEELSGHLSPAQRGFVAQIMQAASRLERNVTDLLDYARVDAGTFRIQVGRANLAEILQEVTTSLQPQMESAQLRLDLQLPTDPLWMDLDRHRIVQVLSNLVTNAIKFSPPHARIVVRAERQGDMVRCEVRDEGEGIAPEDLPRLFQRFSQLQSGSRKGGTGLGLSISKTIVEAHGGQIGVESRLGTGTTFWFTLHRHLPSQESGPVPSD